MNMGSGYVICEYEKVKETLPYFSGVMTALKNDLIARASKDWSTLKFSPPGINPKAGEFGISTVMPQLFNDMSGSRLVTWKQNLTATGHQTLMTGAGAAGTIAEDYKVGLCGLAFLDKTLRVTEIKMQISDKKLPRINIEEAMVYNKPTVIFEDYFILDEETSFDLYGYVEAVGPQRIKLVGLQANRVPNKLQISNTGAALT
jgi:hypothetical protein